MAGRTQLIDEQLTRMAEHLHARRADVLAAWRKAVDADAELTTASSLPRSQFNDHIPNLLDAFEGVLRSWPNNTRKVDDEQQREDAAGHGLQRWQQGYHLREVTREWGHLHLCLLDELQAFGSGSAGAAVEGMMIAQRALAEFCNQGVSESTLRYFQLQQTEAAGHVRDLGQTLEEVQRLEGERAALLHQAAHDLRGNLGAVTNATFALTFDGLAEEARSDFLQLLKKSVSSLHAMLDDVMNLARLQAGHELPNIETFDVAAVLSELCESLRFLASERDLFLKSEGPTSLTVSGDVVKTRRIAQNLLLNALGYTQEGGVTVTWGDSRSNDAKRWMLCIHDTGPGFHAGPGAPIAGALKEATQDSRSVDHRAASEPPSVGDSEADESRRRRDHRQIHQERGEGIGLSIVKRLCELLDASLELASKTGEGTTFRVIFPREYDGAKTAPVAGDNAATRSDTPRRT